MPEQRTPTLSEIQILYEYDGPLIVVLQEVNGPMWLTNASHMGKNGITYFAVEITKTEVAAVTEGRLSLRGAYAGKPWRAIQLDAAGYGFISGGGPAETLDFLPPAGVGLRDEWEGLPDRLEGAGSAEDAPDTNR